MKNKKATLLLAWGIAGSVPAVLSAAPATYTDTQGDQVGSTSPTRDLWSASIDCDSTYLYLGIQLDPRADLHKFLNAYNYAFAITTGSGGDTSDNLSTHGNPYKEAVSLNQSFGGITDWVGLFPLQGGANGLVGFNTYYFNSTNTWILTQNVGSTAAAIAAGTQLTSQPGYSGNSVLSVAVPLSDLPNLSFTPGSSFQFDVLCTGYEGSENTAYDSLVDPLPTQAGTFNNNAQFDDNATTAPNGLYVFTVPEPSSLTLLATATCALLPRRRTPMK